MINSILVKSSGEIIKIINEEIFVENSHSFSDHKILRRKIVLFLSRSHGRKSICASSATFGQFLSLEKLGEAASPLGIAGVPHIPDLDAVVCEVEADDELLVPVLAVGVLGQLGQGVVAENSTIVVEKLR